MKARVGFIVMVGLIAVPQTLRSDDSQKEVSHFSFFERWPEDSHPLDRVPRRYDEDTTPERRKKRRKKKKMVCQTQDLVHHRSKTLRYRVRVHTAFAERLALFDKLVSDLATAHYGRPPRRLRHKGAYNCRAARRRAERISEHAFGNAIDLVGFDFSALRRGDPTPNGMHRRYRRGFRLTISKHWKPRAKRDAYHARFLHALADKIYESPQIFRGIVGPPRPRHGDHLHLDAAPWKYAMYGYKE